jgi:hypothetical protein
LKKPPREIHVTHPDNNNRCNKILRRRPLQQDIRQGLKDRVRDKEDGQRRIVLVVGHVQRLL